MPQPRRATRFPLAVLSLEGRTLQSGLQHAMPVAHPVIISHAHPNFATNPAGVAAITSALSGGMGSEWVKLIRSEVKNLGAVLAGFASGRFSAYSIPGLVAQTPSVQPGFTGQPYDQLLPTLAGAGVFKGNVLELGAIMRGPFHDPATSYYVFALDRGAGSQLGPVFSGRPGITPDTIVTLTVGPYGSSATGTINDLTTGVVSPISASNIRIEGPVIRACLSTSSFPSKGLPLTKYRFAFWTQTQ
ncbi:MAG: hypothetical protein JO161_10180, partial [Planctomycetaceae bacterium]|nr:hypothetical protein [Planctomycetaceae bacterium]